MEIFTTIGRKYVPVDTETMNKLEQMSYQKAAIVKNNWYKTSQRKKTIEEIAKQVFDKNVKYYCEDDPDGLKKCACLFLQN